MALPLALVWDLIARDNASATFNRVAGSADRAAVATARANGEVAASGKRMGGLGKAIVGLGLLDLGAHMGKMAGDFQQSTNVLVTAAGETTSNLALVRKGILDIATSTGTKWHEVVDGMYVLEKAGYRGAEALKVEKAAAQGAREEGAALGTVTNALTSIMASYHLPASKAVATMNEMKTAAGESKTTMEQFAGALSTVLPLASANHISFAGVAGVLATLTQHGVSADQATQELAFSIRGLAAPNQVAVKEMAQLGISSVDVSQKLGDGPGGRGLAGTLNYLSETVLHKMGPAGTLLLSTFNASKVAAHDAEIEFKALDPATQKIAQQFKDGKINAAGWTEALKGMTPEQNNLAKQFAVTWRNANGFQQAIRNGVSGSQTYSDAIKKMTGGANGLNVVLQATGDSMDGTNERIKRIADASNGAGKDVSGWASTQKLFNVQFDMFKQEIDRVMIELGTKLLPVFTSVIGAVRGGIQWFDGLSSGLKTFTGQVLLAVVGVSALSKIIMTVVRSTIVGWAAAGVVSLVRLTAGFTATAIGAESMATRSYAAGIRMRAGMLGATNAMSGLKAAVAGAAIGLAVGALTAHASAATKAIGVLGSAAAGAAIGFSTGGPLGAAIGGIGGALGTLAGQFLGAGSAAHHVVPQIAGLTEAIRSDSDAIGANTDLLIANSLQKSGMYDDARRLGISQRTLTLAVKGNSTAMAEVANVIATKTNPALRSSYGLSNKQADANYNNAKSARHLSQGMGDLTGQLKGALQGARNIDAGLGKLSATSRKTAASQDHLGSTTHRVTSALESLSGMSNTTLAGLSKLGQPHSVNVDTSTAMSRLNALLAAIPSGTFHFNVQADYQAHLNSMIPGHAIGGFLDPGINLVGENGPELIDRATGMVTTAPQTAKRLGNDAMIAELRRTTAAVMTVGGQVADALNGVSRQSLHKGRTAPSGRTW